jgi:hypothetical protein
MEMVATLDGALAAALLRATFGAVVMVLLFGWAARELMHRR